MTRIKIKRAYEKPEPDDGFRVFVDRLWPRGMRKEDFRYDLWAKQIAPSAALRRWYPRRYAGALGRVRPPLRRGIAAVASRGGIHPSDHRKRHRYVGVRLPERFAESCPDPARLSGKSYECYDCIVVIQVVYLRVNCCRDSIIGVYPFVEISIRDYCFLQCMFLFRSVMCTPFRFFCNRRSMKLFV